MIDQVDLSGKMSKKFDQLVEIMARLRGEGGCPWDREQTRESLKAFLIEECYEVLEAIDREKVDDLKEELGDVLFQVLFHAQIAKENKEFTIEDILETTIDKMTRRHPHVFEGEGSPGLTAKEVLARWEETKRSEGKNAKRGSALDGVPKSLPALLRAQQIQARAARVGFDWKEIAPVREKVEEEWNELTEAIGQSDPGRIEAELGDLLFALVNYARHLNVQPEEALRKTIGRFSERFSAVERKAAEQGRRLSELSLEEMDRLWEQAKAGNR
jgi:tetrapyrrole methylase family protein/MazG family protein